MKDALWLYFQLLLGIHWDLFKKYLFNKFIFSLLPKHHNQTNLNLKIGCLLCPIIWPYAHITYVIVAKFSLVIKQKLVIFFIFLHAMEMSHLSSQILSKFSRLNHDNSIPYINHFTYLQVFFYLFHKVCFSWVWLICQHQQLSV